MGVERVEVARHPDHRGSLTEVVDLDDDFWREPIVYAYSIVIAPGTIKGWGMHRLQADRGYVASGTVRTVLYDGREESPSFGAFAQYHFAESTPALLRVPPGVWHAHQNYGEGPAVVINFPTVPFNHSDPDKYRIDPASGEIPFDFTLRDG